MKIANGISGGQSSAMLMEVYPADYNFFSLVRVEPPKKKEYDLLWMGGKDEKTRQLVSDRLGVDFYGTPEDDKIIYTILDLEQYFGKDITMLTGETFDDVIRFGGGKLPDLFRRYCTTDMKFNVVAKYIHRNIKEPVLYNLGFRSGEGRRVNNVLKKVNKRGLLEVKLIIGKHKNENNKWGTFEIEYPNFPLYEKGINKMDVVNFWKDKPVRFARKNNCLMCFHQDPLYLKYWHGKDEQVKKAIEWAATKEQIKHEKDIWFGKTNMTLEELIKKEQTNLLDQLSDEDFSDCDSGFCGL
jgi:hypothetical protein